MTWSVCAPPKLFSFVGPQVPFVYLCHESDKQGCDVSLGLLVCSCYRQRNVREHLHRDRKKKEIHGCIQFLLSTFTQTVLTSRDFVPQFAHKVSVSFQNVRTLKKHSASLPGLCSLTMQGDGC